MKAIVHIGTEKTGTSSIQRFLYQNQKVLKSAGVHFLQSAGKMNNRAIPAYCISDDRYDDFYRELGIRTFEGKQEFKQKFIQKFEGELRTVGKNTHTVVISSEHFHSRIRTEEELDNVHNLLSRYFEDFKIVCYLREQGSMCSSFYSTHMRNSGTESLSDFMRRCKPENYYFNYYQMLENWERCFGFESLDVSLFSPSRLFNHDLLDDFTAKIDVGLVGKLNRLVDVENESLRPLGQALARAINMVLPLTSERPEYIDMRTRSKKLIVEKLTGKGQQPGIRARQRMYESFVESNEKLREKYFPAVDCLFSPPAEDVQPDHSISKEDFDVIADILNIFKKKGGDADDPGVYASIFNAIFSCISDATRIEPEPIEPESSKQESVEIRRALLLSDGDASLFRKAARRLESDNLQGAIRLTSLAATLRPDWSVPKTQLERYRQRESESKKSRFLIAYHDGPTVMTPKVSEVYPRFNTWLAGLPVPVGARMTVTKDATTVNLEGTVSADHSIRMDGFSIVEAESLEAVLAMVKDCPFLEMDGLVYVSRLELISMSREEEIG